MITSENDNERSPAEKSYVTVGTTYVEPDENAMALVEINLVSPKPGAGWRRYQIIYVNREDRLAEFRRDMGPKESFESMQFRIPALWEHTVAELLDMADEMRAQSNERFQNLPKPKTGDEYLDGIHQEQEKRQWLSRGRTIYGGK